MAAVVMRPWLALLIVACSSPSPERAPVAHAAPAPPKDALTALIANTNALAGFTARYQYTGSDSPLGSVGTMTLFYAAPDRAAIFFEGEKGKTRVWIEGDRLTQEVKVIGECHDFGSFDASAGREIKASLDSEFPTRSDAAGDFIGPGVTFAWTWHAPQVPVSAQGQSAGWQNSTSIGVDIDLERTRLLGWLPWLFRRKEQPGEVGEAWVWNLEHAAEIHISKSSGFVTKTRCPGPDGNPTECTLETLELWPASTETLTAPRVLPEGARWCSAEMEGSMSAILLDTARSDLWRNLSKRVEAEQVSWGEDSPEKLKRVFRTLHAHYRRIASAKWIPEVREWIEANAKDKREPADLRRARERALGELTEMLDKEIRELLTLSPPKSAPAEFRLTQVFLNCERAAALAEYELQVRGPLISYLNEHYDAAMRRQ